MEFLFRHSHFILRLSALRLPWETERELATVTETETEKETEKDAETKKIANANATVTETETETAPAAPAHAPVHLTAPAHDTHALLNAIVLAHAPRSLVLTAAIATSALLPHRHPENVTVMTPRMAEIKKRKEREKGIGRGQLCQISWTGSRGSSWRRLGITITALEEEIEKQR